MINKKDFLPVEEALRRVKEFDLLVVIERGYENNGCIWFDLSSGQLVEEGSEIAVKLYCHPNPLNNLPDPFDSIPDKHKLTEENLEELEDEAEKEKEELQEKSKWELEEIGLDEIKMDAIKNEQEIRRDWENRIKDFYFINGILKSEKDS